MKRSLPLRVKIASVGEPQLADYALSQSPIDTPEAVFDFWKALVESQPDHETEKENLVSIELNTRLKPVSWHRVALGSQNECVAHPREILRTAIIQGAYAIVLCHNHPSGDPSPSDADRRLTQRLRDGAELLQIRLVDHVIIGALEPFSFRGAGLL